MCRWRRALGALGAVVGAGFAAGRELEVFFVRSGSWWPLGVLGAAASFAFLAAAPTADGEHNVRRAAYTALAATVGGAMLACVGEAAALLLPMHGARWVGMAGALLLACAARERLPGALAVASCALTGVLCVLLVSGLLHPGEARVFTPASAAPVPALLRGLCYGGFNAALAQPVIGGDRRAARLTGGLLAALLALGCGALLAHPETRGEALPILRMTAPLGKNGYLLCAAALLLAALTTLLACFAGLSAALPHGRLTAPALLLACALVGFADLVSAAYPVLGAVCCVLLPADRLRRT